MQRARTTPSPGTAEQPLGYLAMVVCLGAVYDIAARFGLSWATVHENITVIWPPSGLVLAVFLRFGMRFWPGVFAGSLLANLATSVGFAAAAGIAAGDTLEGLAAAALLGWTGFDRRLGRLPDMLRLVMLGGLASPVVAAGIGATVLCLAGAPWANFGPMWTAWWLGDGLSIIVITPFLLTWTDARSTRLSWRSGGEAIVIGAVIVAASAYAFGGSGSVPAHPAVAYAAFPAVLFATVRFGTRGATASVLLATGVGVWAITARSGTVAAASPDALTTLQVFAASLAVSALALAAALAEREQALGALRRSEAQTARTRTLLADALDSLRDHFLLYDADDRLVMVNKAAREWNPAFAAVTTPGTHIADVARAAIQTWHLNHPDIDVEAYVQRRLAEHRNFDAVYEQKFGDRWLRIREFPTSDGGVVVVRMDITQQKEQEAALTEARNQLVSSIEALSDAFALYDAQDRLVLCNSKYKEVYAISADLLVPGARFEDIIRDGARRGQYADAAGRIDAFVAERMAAHRNPTGTIEQQLADGRWLRVAERRMPSGHTVGIRTDITELKMAIAALQQSEAKASKAHALLVDALESIDDGFLLWDANDRLVLSNNAINRMFPDQAGLLVPGITFSELIERRVRAGHIVDAIGHEDDFIRARVARHRTPFEAIEQTLDSGAWIRIRERRTGEGGMAVVLTDITKLKEREAELIGARSEAVNANRAKSEFLAMMSHELRTPLNVVIGFAEILRSQGKGLAANKVVDYAGDIYEAGRYLLALLNDVLDLSKAEAGKMELQVGPVSLKDIIDRALRMIRERATQRQIALTAHVEPGLPTLEADERKLMQILLNLLSNAVKFTPEGGRVTVTAAGAGDDRVAIAVIDTGIGIAPENIEKALTAFGQVNNLMTRDQAGTGLGLPLAKRLAELHGGSLELHSKVGAGTTVTLRFPVRPARSAAVA
jgi:signal transduction histidine kinase/integral membrane sensor domain MASE1